MIDIYKSTNFLGETREIPISHGTLTPRKKPRKKRRASLQPLRHVASPGEFHVGIKSMG